MKRDKLIARLIKLPPSADIILRVGAVDVEIVGLDLRSKHRAALQPHLGDLRDALIEEGLPPKDTRRLTAGGTDAGMESDPARAG